MEAEGAWLPGDERPSAEAAELEEPGGPSAFLGLALDFDRSPPLRKVWKSGLLEPARTPSPLRASAKQSHFRKGGRRWDPARPTWEPGFCPPSHMSKASLLPAEMPTPASWKPHSEKDEFLPPEDRAPLLPVEKEINWEST